MRARKGYEAGFVLFTDRLSQPDGGGYTADIPGATAAPAGRTTGISRTTIKKDYAKCFEAKIKPQVTELLTGYGDSVPDLV